jgi:7-carboxy-7-deazaguanine synthase
MPHKLMVNEVFYSLQGEGIRTGTANVFVRLSGCNLQCDLDPGPLSPGGWRCDTEFVSGRGVTLEELHAWILRESQVCRWLILTGGEPTLQLDQTCVDFFHARGYQLAIETNGTHNVDAWGLDWICVSPKTAEHTLRQLTASEVKYVRCYGQGIPKPRIEAAHYLISPAFEPDARGHAALVHPTV